MNKKLLSLSCLILILFGLVISPFQIQNVKASNTIYIRADGSIDPDTAPLSIETVSYPWGDMDVYTFTDDITESIVVHRNNSVIDGAGYSLTGDGTIFSTGIYLEGNSSTTETRITNVILQNLTVSQFYVGIIVRGGYGVQINDCNIYNNTGDGIHFTDVTMWSRVERCEITGNGDDGIELEGTPAYPYLGCRNNFILQNNISFNGFWDWNGNGVHINNAFEGFNSVQENHIAGNGLEGVKIDNSRLNDVSNNTIIDNASDGVDVDNGQYTALRDNIIQGNGDDGVDFDIVSYGNIERNNITGNLDDGVNLDLCTQVRFSENLVEGNTRYGIEIVNSSGNYILYNNFVNNPQHVYSESSINYWNTSYFSLVNGISTLGSNYWDDYEDHHLGEDTDVSSGPNQDEPESDGIWDAPYVIDGDNQDNYPRTTPYVGEPDEPDLPQQYDLSVHVYDEDTQAGISAAMISVYFAGNDILAKASTTVDGVAIFSLVEGSYYIMVQAEGYEEYTGNQFQLTEDTIQDVPMTRPPKVATTISCSASPTEIIIESTVTVSGSISPAVSSATVTLTYTKPDDSTFQRTLTSGSDGSYSDTFTPDSAGS